MSALIVCASVSPYGNSRRVAQAMAPVLGAQITALEAVTAGEVAAHQLPGFGSGIYSFTYHRSCSPSSNRGPVKAARYTEVLLTSHSGHQAGLSWWVRHKLLAQPPTAAWSPSRTT